MYINHVLSFHGAWSRLKIDYEEAFQDLCATVSGVSPPFTENMRSRPGDQRFWSTMQLARDLEQDLQARGWRSDELPLQNTLSKRSVRFDLLKNGVGLDIAFGKYPFVESTVFVAFPLFHRANKLRLGLVVVAMQSLARMAPGVSRFETVRDRLSVLYPLPLKYPFAVIGISHESTELVVEEMTSELDQFLLHQTGLTLMEMGLISETSAYDFKRELPQNNKLAQEVCAFANRNGGGLILIGVDNQGKIVGVSRDEIDSMMLRITNVVRTTCSPAPEFGFEVFDDPSKPSRCVLTVVVKENVRKPCMVDGRAYVRIGSSVRHADSEEIRGLILAE